MENSGKPVTAAVLVIGDEILSGRTPDTNPNYIAKFLSALGIDLCEARVVPDIEAEIVAALNALRTRYNYVFTTGGIGPTHDDITADAVARAFGVGIDYNAEAMALLGARYKPGEFNEMRKRMARIPDGATLIKNSISTAPGFQIGNVFVMAGVPMIMRAMLEESVAPRLQARRGGDLGDRRGEDRRGTHRGRTRRTFKSNSRTPQSVLIPITAKTDSACSLWCEGGRPARWKKRPLPSKPPYARRG